jgi:hypothetical protein
MALSGSTDRISGLGARGHFADRGGDGFLVILVQSTPSLGFNLLGDVLRDTLDPRLRGR